MQPLLSNRNNFKDWCFMVYTGIPRANPYLDL